MQIKHLVVEVTRDAGGERPNDVKITGLRLTVVVDGRKTCDEYATAQLALPTADFESEFDLMLNQLKHAVRQQLGLTRKCPRCGRFFS